MFSIKIYNADFYNETCKEQKTQGTEIEIPLSGGNKYKALATVRMGKIIYRLFGVGYL